MASNLVRLCTAALAGTVIGITYERLRPEIEWPNLLKSVTAAGSAIKPRSINIDTPDLVPYKTDVIDPILAGENFKHSGRFGLPSKDNLRLFNNFLLSYDRRLRAPAWVIEHLTPDKLNENKASRDNSKFHEDMAIHEFFRSKYQDFTNTGFDRGHMAAAGNHKLGQDAMDQTFSLSNITPQTPNLNRGVWERLETYVRWLAKRSKNLYVVSGPLYLPMKARDGNLYVTYRVLGNNHVSVPTHFFKVFLVETKDDKFSLEAFLMPNDFSLTDDAKINDFRIPIDRLDILERASGVIFFELLDRDKIEAPNQLSNGFKDTAYSKRIAPN